MSRCDLYLENYVGYYAGGDTIIGHVPVTFHSDKEINGIFVNIKGKAQTSWTETESYYNVYTKTTELRSILYHGSQVFISREIELLDGTRTIAAGAYKYPFRFTLPENLQSTFEGSVGKIEYKIKAEVKRSMLKSNYKAKSPIVIVTPVNLNLNPSLRNPVCTTRTKNTYFCCWSKGSITVEVKMPQTGIAIGEQVPLHISVQNLSRSNIDQIKCKVKKMTEYIVTSPDHRAKRDWATIFSDSYGGVGAHGENTYDKMVHINSASSIPNFINCSIIKVSYNLRITFVLSGMHKNIEINIPITVGHIALSGMAPQEVSTAPPSYGFVGPQPAYNPDVVPGMPVPPVYASTLPSAPLASGAEDQADKDLPTYDQATSYPMKS